MIKQMHCFLSNTWKSAYEIERNLLQELFYPPYQLRIIDDTVTASLVNKTNTDCLCIG